MDHPGRLRFPGAEARLPWLGLLLDAYALVDASVRDAAAAAGRPAACVPGCAACCSHPVMATACEVAGLSWCVTEIMDPPLRPVLAANLVRGGARCPFLARGRCAAYALRPAACRRYVVLGRACAPGEDPTADRPGDVLAPDRAALREAHRRMLPFFGITGPAEQDRALAEGLLLRRAAPLQAMDWTRLAGVLAGRAPRG
ncbi:MAG: YkgJ family cysteine cluster protein [Thermodesulfobacteriota bacterium]